MRVLHIVSGELNGGAARGAYWLHKGLIDLGIDSYIFTSSKETYGDKNVISILNNPKEKIIDLTRRQADNLMSYMYPDRQRRSFSTGFFGYDLTKLKDYKKVDIVHLHWVSRGFINIKHLRKIEKPMVWTIRDMWPMTGGCHYSLECNRFKTGCGQCVQLGSRSKHDLSWLVLKRKKKFLPKNIKLVGISSWISEQARKSYLFKNFDIRTIHNNINSQDFFPIDKSIARSILGITTKKKVILMGANNITSFYKGFEKFIDSLNYLNPNHYYLCFFGKLGLDIVRHLGFEYKDLGFLHDLVSLRLAYSCANAFVAPSLMEAFGKTLIESMACGTPVICFDATGPKDIVTHKVDGYKAKAFDSQDLARGIEWVVNNPNYSEFCDIARSKVIDNFDSKIIAKKYISLYEEIKGLTES